MIVLAHALLATAASVELVRALHQSWVRAVIRDEPALFAFVVGLPVLSALASALSVALGLRTRTPRRALVTDLAGALLALGVVVPLAMGQTTREVAGLYFVAILAARLAPSLVLVLDGRERSTFAVFAISAVWCAGLALWSGASTLAQGDQPHYLLVADRLVHGSVDVAPAYATPDAFHALSGVDMSREDLETHAIETPRGLRPVQGYGLALLITPGWALAGRDGALLVIALVAAFASAQTYLLCRETVRDARLAHAAWALTALLAPMATLAAVVFPNVAGAAALVVAYRLLFTAERRRPLLAALVASTTLLLTPRDFAAVAFLAPFALLLGRRIALRVTIAGLLAIAAVAALDVALYGLPLPYAGYVYGVGAAQRLLGEPTLSFEVWRALPGMLFDPAYGLAGSAPWAFLGLAGVVTALRADRARLLPALAAVAGSIVALSVYRLWQGGWSPPNRYVVDVLPLWAPFVAYGIVSLPRAATVALVSLGAVASFFFAAIPNLAYNTIGETRLVEALDQVLVVDPFAWLPSFEVPNLGALAIAWLRATPFIAGVVALVWLGTRQARLPRVPPAALFVILNFGGVATLALAARPDGAGAREEQALATALVTRWLPFALALATLLTLAFRDQRLYARHASLWLAVPATLALVRFGDGLDARVLALPYVALVLAIAAHGLAALYASLRTRSDREVGLLLGATLLASALALLPYDRTVHLTQADEPHYLVAMRSLARDLDLDVKDEYDQAEYRDFYAGDIPDRHVVHVRTREYPIHDLGLVLLGAIPFAIAGRTGVLALLCVVGALIAWRGYALLRRFGFAPEVAFLAVGAFAFLHPIFTYTTQVYPELLGALALLLVAELLVETTLARAAVAGALAGTLPWLSARFWPMAVALLAVLAWNAARARSPRLALASFIPFALVVGAYAVLDELLFGLPVPNAGYYAIRDEQHVLAFAPLLSVPGLAVDRAFGLLSRVPIYALALVGVVPLLRARRSPPLAALGLAWLFSFALTAVLAYWYADDAPSSRYLVATLPFLLCCVAAALERGVHRYALAALALPSAAVTALFALSPSLRYDLVSEIAASDGPGRLWEFVAFAYRLSPGLAFPSLVRGSAQDLVLAAGWAVVLVALVLVGSRGTRR